MSVRNFVFNVGGTPFTPVSGDFSVGGTVADGGTITISKASGGFGVKPNGDKPVCVLNFGKDGTGLTDIGLGRQGMTAVNLGTSVSSTSVIRSGSAYSRKFDVASASVYERLFDVDLLPVTPVAASKWQHWCDWYNDWIYTMVDPYLGAPNIKWMRWVSAGANATPYISTVMQDTTQRSRFSPPAGGGEYDCVFGLSSYYNVRQWRGEGQLVRCSSANDVADAYLNMMRNGAVIDDLPNVVSHTAVALGGSTGTGPLEANPYTYWKIESAYWADPGVAPFYFDLIYIDDSWCNVVVSDSATYTTAEESSVAIQIPQSWADGEIRAVVRVGHLGTLAGKYLYVQTNDGTRIKIGQFT